ncbi:MAG: serine hydrolase [Minisyncoccia bacterium]
MTEEENKIMADENLDFSEQDTVQTEGASELGEQRTSPIPVLPQLSVALGILVLVFGVTYVGSAHSLAKKATAPDVRVEASLGKNANDSAERDAHVFDDTQLMAKSAFVWDVAEQKILFNKNGDEELPLASITKLMTALVAYELLDPEQKIRISNDSIKTDGDSGLSEGEEFSMQDLTDLTLISSSNDGAVALSAEAARSISSRDSEEVFVTAMNLKAKQLGLTHTSFKNTTGLDLSSTSIGAYGSARDVALLMENIIVQHAEVTALTSLDVTTISNKEGEYHLVKNTNETVNDIEGLIASKTGYTTLAGGNLVVAFNAGLNRPVIVVVLGSSQSGRFEDMLTLVEKARRFISSKSE